MEIQTCALDVWRGRVFICRFISSPPSWSFYKHLSRGIQADDRSTFPASRIISMQNSAIQHPDTMMLFLISSTSSFLQVRIFSSSRCPAKTMSSSAIKYELFPPLQLREKTLNVFRQAWKSRVGIIGQQCPPFAFKTIRGAGSGSASTGLRIDSRFCDQPQTSPPLKQISDQTFH